MSRLRADQGSQAVELALVSLVLLLVATAAVPLLQLGLAQNRLGRASAEGLRFATRALPNPCRAGEAGCPFTDLAGCPSTLRRRPSSNEVTEYVRQAAGSPAGLTVSLDHVPCESNSGQQIVLTVSHEYELGPMADAANRVAQLVAGRAPLPATVEVRSTITGFEE